MAYGIVTWKDNEGRMKKGILTDVNVSVGGVNYLRAVNVEDIDEEYPKPFRFVGREEVYDVYTMFHPQLTELIDTRGYFYNTDDDPEQGEWGSLEGIGGSGQPMRVGNGLFFSYAYFAVPVAGVKSKPTLQEVLDKVEMTKEELMELITNSIREDK